MQYTHSTHSDEGHSKWSIQLYLASLTAGTSPVVPVVIKIKEYSKTKQEKIIHIGAVIIFTLTTITGYKSYLCVYSPTGR